MSPRSRGLIYINRINPMMRRWGRSPTMTSPGTGLEHNRINAHHAPSATRAGARYDPDGIAGGHRAAQSWARRYYRLRV
jgi:hypothetical protein